MFQIKHWIFVQQNMSIYTKKNVKKKQIGILSIECALSDLCRWTQGIELNLVGRPLF